MSNIEFWKNEWEEVTSVDELVSDFDSQINAGISGSHNLREVKIIVTSKIIGKAQTWTYPYDDGNLYEIPTYQLKLVGKNSRNQQYSKEYEVIRFGVTRRSPNAQSKPYTVGLADKQTHIIKQWIPTYSVHSASSSELGAWRVYGDFLIHDGPDDPHSEVYASIGCVEICNGPQGFDTFNDEIIIMTGVSGRDRSEKLLTIGRSRKLTIEYEKANRPPVKKI